MYSDFVHNPTCSKAVQHDYIIKHNNIIAVGVSFAKALQLKLEETRYDFSSYVRKTNIPILHPVGIKPIIDPIFYTEYH